ncbi:MAG TPA: IS21-like element helper ATPase IstB [Polyangiaceae bacterium]
MTTIEETLTKLSEMRLPSMVLAVRELMDTAPGHQLSFEEKLGIVVDREWLDRDNRRLARRLKDAKLATRASLDNVLCDPERGVDKGTMRQLAGCQWVKSKHNVVIVGKTGVGKSYLGSALADAACRTGYRALFMRVPRLLEEMALARAAGDYSSLLGKLSRIDVLVLDDFLLNPMTDVERRDLLEVLEDRYDRTSTVITTQVPTKTWHEALSDPTIADAICDRLVHNAHVLKLGGPSIRRKKALQQESQPAA